MPSGPLLKGVILDKFSFDQGDLDLSPLAIAGIEWTAFESSRHSEAGTRITHCDVVITNKVRLLRADIETAANLKLILIAATGTDNVDLTACKERGVTVCNVRNYATASVAQHTIAMMLNLLTRQMHYAGDVRAGHWHDHPVFCLLNHPITECAGKTLGIIGYGTLGRKVAAIAEALGMRCLLWQRPHSPVRHGRVDLNTLLSASDVVSIHCPLNDETRHLINDAALQRMKPTAILLNTARGAIVDSHALAEALRTGSIAGAGIDVLNQEPPPREHPLLSGDIPNLIVTPHNAWGSRESRQRMVNIMGDNLGAWLSGSPQNVVSP